MTNALLQLRQLKAQWESNKAFKEMAEAVLGKEMFQKFSGDQISRIGTRLSDIRELNTKSRHKFYNFVGKLLNEVLETLILFSYSHNFVNLTLAYLYTSH